MPRHIGGVTTDYAEMASLVFAPNTDVFSLAAWIKTTSTNGAIFGSDSGSGVGRFCQFRVAGSKLNSITFHSSTANSLSSSANVNTGAWVHVGMTSDGTNVALYINGAQDGRASTDPTAGSDAHNWRIGNEIPGVSVLPFTGDIADAAMWKRTLSASEMALLASGASPLLLAPYHYYPLWGVDSPEPDLGSTSKLAGTLTGTTKGSGGPPLLPSLLKLSA